jgi:RHS repeat-associated protein
MELDGNGNPINAYTHLPGIDLPLSVKVGGDSAFAYYYTMEQPGHVSALLNTSGGIAARYRYAPFGRIESSSGSVSQSLKFMGRELDNTTGLYYVRARWYDPSLARFISSDPIGLDGGINTYAYVGNAPMDARDPSGLQATPADCSKPNACLEPVIVRGCEGVNPFVPGCGNSGFFESPSLKAFGGLRATDQVGRYFINDSTAQRAARDAASREAREEENRRRADTEQMELALPLDAPECSRYPDLCGEPPPPSTGAPSIRGRSDFEVAEKKRQCAQAGFRARAWTFLHTFGRVGAGLNKGSVDPNGATAHFDRNWGTSMNTNYDQFARDMAALTCMGVLD